MNRQGKAPTMKRLYSACPNRRFSSKMYEAPNAWQRYPNACLCVTSMAVLNSSYPDKPRLFSGLIRVVRRQMTFNEASASHGISLTVIKELWKGIFTAMSNAMMKLMNENKTDLRLRGDEMNESAFPYGTVTEEDLITITDESGEEYAVIDPATLPPSHFNSEIYASDHECVAPKEEDSYPFPSSSQQHSHPVEYATPKEENVDIYPGEQNGLTPQYVVPKEEEQQLFSNGLVEPKEEEEDYYTPFDEQYPSTSNGFDARPSSFAHKIVEVKEEPMEAVGQYTIFDPTLKQPRNDSLLDCSMRELGYNDPMDQQKNQRQREEEFVDPEEEENPEICNAIRMTIKSSKLQGEQAWVMREVLKDSMIRQVSIPEIAKLYGFADSMKITHMVNKSRIFLKAICRKAGKGLPEAFTATSKELKNGPPLLPLLKSDKKRIQKINDVINSLVKRCMYSRAGKERLTAALYSICTGEITLNAAANKFNLPSSSIHPYVRKARIRLGSVLPPQAHQPVSYTSMVMKSAPVEPEPKKTREVCPQTGRVSVPMEELDEIVTELVKNSQQYDAAGKQAIFEAVVAVITEGISAVTASTRTGIPASTIQNYVWKARGAMGLPQRTSREVEFQPRKKEPPTVALSMRQVFAPKEEVEQMVNHMLRTMARGSRRDKVFAATMASVMGEMRIREAAVSFEIPPATLHPYVTKIRLALGERCPPSKACITTRTRTLTRKGARIDDEITITMKENEIVDIDGIRVPKSIRLLTRLITLGRINYNQAIPFMGSRDELYFKLESIVEAFQFKGDVEHLVEAIMHVYVDDKTINEACTMYKLTNTTLASYVRAVKVFIDFERTPCTSNYQSYQMREESEEMQPAHTSDMMPDPLPHAPPSEMSAEFQAELRAAVKREKDGVAIKEEVKEEPIDEDEVPVQADGFLNQEEAEADAQWDGEGVDAITRKLSTLYECDKWMVDDRAGRENGNLLPTLLHARVADGRKLHRLKAAAQYVVNDRHGGSREAMYLRPLLIHHLCNGFALDYLLEIYGGRITVTEEMLTEYASMAKQMYTHSGAIVLELIVKLVKCNRTVDGSPSTRDEYDQARKAMTDEYPFLANPRVIPETPELLAKEEVKRRKVGVDLFVYTGLQTITQLRQLGFLLNDRLVKEIVRRLSFHISPSFLPSEYVDVWVAEYMKDVVQTNAANI